MTKPSLQLQAPARPATSPAAEWFQLMTDGAKAWTDACCGMTEMIATSSAAQAKSIADFWSLGARGFEAQWPTQDMMILAAEGQAERFADACRETIQHLSRRGAPGVRPLPE